MLPLQERSSSKKQEYERTKEYGTGSFCVLWRFVGFDSLSFFSFFSFFLYLHSLPSHPLIFVFPFCFLMGSKSDIHMLILQSRSFVNWDTNGLFAPTEALHTNLSQTLAMKGGRELFQGIRVREGFPMVRNQVRGFAKLKKWFAARGPVWFPCPVALDP